MTAVQTSPPVTGYIPGTWTIDTTHSEVGFSVRHLMVSKVKGKFTEFSGTFVTGRTRSTRASRPASSSRRSTPATPTVTRTCVRPTSSRPTSTRC